MGIDGSNKMSKSLDNAIYIRDSYADVVRKVDNMKWTENSEKDINVVIEYIKIFAPNHYNTIYNRFINGTLTEKEAKEFLVDSLEDVLQPMRDRMKPYLENKVLVFDLLYNGTLRAKSIADESMLELRNAIGLVDLEIQKKINLGKTK